MELQYFTDYEITGEDGNDYVCDFSLWFREYPDGTIIYKRVDDLDVYDKERNYNYNDTEAYDSVLKAIRHRYID